MQLLKLCLNVILLSCLLISCGNEDSIEIIVVNNTDELLKNINFQTLSDRSIGHNNLSKRESIQIEILDVNKSSPILMVSFLNLDCLSMTSDSKKLELIDCRSNNFVHKGKYLISIEENDISWSEIN